MQINVVVVGGGGGGVVVVVVVVVRLSEVRTKDPFLETPKKHFGPAKPFYLYLKNKVVYNNEALHEQKLSSYEKYVKRTAL